MQKPTPQVGVTISAKRVSIMWGVLFRNRTLLHKREVLADHAFATKEGAQAFIFTQYPRARIRDIKRAGWHRPTPVRIRITVEVVGNGE